jgi:hypothetical protein
MVMVLGVTVLGRPLRRRLLVRNRLRLRSGIMSRRLLTLVRLLSGVVIVSRR